MENESPASRDVMISLSQRLYDTVRPWQTRLMKLTHADLNQPLVADLVVSDLIAKPGMGITSTFDIVQYTALSYTWGLPNFIHTITCNGIDYPITENLSEAIAHIRAFQIAVGDHLFLWVDALCINQFDLVEKSYQVQDMLLIFQKAEKVLAWIGMPLNSLSNSFDKLEKHTSNKVNNMPISERSFQSHSLQEEISHIFSQPWFRRTWVRQEVFAAKDLTLQLGQYAIDADSFARKVQRNSFELSASARQGVHAFYLLLSRRGQTQKLPFPEGSFGHSNDYMGHILCVLSESNYFSATDPRDVIFGVMGIVQSLTHKVTLEDFQKHYQTSPYPIDYSLTLSRVYQEFIRYNIRHASVPKHTNALDLRILSIFEKRSIQSLDIPTWTIDWRRPVKRYRELPRRPFDLYTSHNHIGDGDILRLSGRDVGCVCGNAEGISRAIQSGEMATPIGEPGLEIVETATSFGAPGLEIVKTILTGSQDHESLTLNLVDSFYRISFCNIAGFNYRKEFGIRDIIQDCNYKFVLLSLRLSQRYYDQEFHLQYTHQPSRHLILALVSDIVNCEDQLVEFEGSQTVFVVRQIGKTGNYIFLGCAILFTIAFHKTNQWVLKPERLYREENHSHAEEPRFYNLI